MVMIGTSGQKRRLFAVAHCDLEPEDITIECNGALQIGNFQMDVANTGGRRGKLSHGEISFAFNIGTTLLHNRRNFQTAPLQKKAQGRFSSCQKYLRRRPPP
jgi:hypothetical protein